MAHGVATPEFGAGFSASAEVLSARSSVADWPLAFVVDFPVGKFVSRAPAWSFQAGFFTTIVHGRTDLIVPAGFLVEFSASLPLSRRGGVVSPLTSHSYLVTTRQFPRVRR